MEVLEAMTAPTVDGQPSLPKRRGPKGLLPSTWLERTLKVAYTDCYGSGQELRAGWAEHHTQPFGWTVEAWLLTRLAGWVSENPRHQGFAAKDLPELDALAEPTGADA